jgi:hypothetical protein
MTNANLLSMSVLLGTMAAHGKVLWRTARATGMQLHGLRREWTVLPQNSGGSIEVAVTGQLADESTLAFVLSVECQGEIAIPRATLELVDRDGGQTLWEQAAPAVESLGEFEHATSQVATALSELMGAYAPLVSDRSHTEDVRRIASSLVDR